MYQLVNRYRCIPVTTIVIISNGLYWWCAFCLPSFGALPMTSTCKTFETVIQTCPVDAILTGLTLWCSWLYSALRCWAIQLRMLRMTDLQTEFQRTKTSLWIYFTSTLMHHFAVGRCSPKKMAQQNALECFWSLNTWTVELDPYSTSDFLLLDVRWRSFAPTLLPWKMEDLPSQRDDWCKMYPAALNLSFSMVWTHWSLVWTMYEL